MNGARLAGAVGGGLLAGLGISAMMLAGEKKSGKPSELTDLERSSAEMVGMEPRPASAPPVLAEQLVTHAGHLLLSAVAGVAYAGLVEEEEESLSSGLAFGMAFYAAAHGIAGPALGVQPPLWRVGVGPFLQHGLVHALFGVATAYAAHGVMRATAE